MTIGALNRYTCNRCNGHIITIDRDIGVTPFSLNCRATANCQGTMYSSFYQEFDGRPSFEWRKPTADEIIKASVAMREHFRLGGLDIHPITPEITS